MGLHKLMSVILVLALTTAYTNAQPRPVPPKILKPARSSCPGFTYDAIYDLQNNVITSHPKVTVVSPITGTGCNAQGVLKIELASAAVDPNRRRVVVDLIFENPTNFVFNIGDSKSNNGYAGDAGDQRWDAEVQGVGTTFTGYLSDNGNSVSAFNIPNLYTSSLILGVSDGMIIWMPNNNDLANHYRNSTFFALNGQSEPNGSSNYDLYLGINRAIASNARSGSGLCKVSIKFLKEF